MEQIPSPPPPQPSIPQPSSKLPLIIAGIIFIFLVTIGAYYLGKKTNNPVTPTIQPTFRACTEEAKVCPDGSTVGRTGPNCEFAPCPTKTNSQNNIEDKACGGIMGEKGEFACPTGYKCQYPKPMYPDAQGKCAKE